MMTLGRLHLYGSLDVAFVGVFVLSLRSAPSIREFESHLMELKMEVLEGRGELVS